MSAVSASPLLLTCLERFEKQSREILNRDVVVGLFCREIIPFLAKNSIIDVLKNDWRSCHEILSREIRETEALALLETKETFQEIKKILGNVSNPVIEEKMSLIEKLVIGQDKRYGSSPLYCILYRELKQLFELLLKNGCYDLCKKYAKLASRKIYVQKDPKQTVRWARHLEDGQVSHFLNAKEIQEAQEDEESLIFLPPDYELIDEIYIEEITFASAVIKAYAAMDAIHWERHQNPAIIWWYFESALWCWQTPESYFDQIMISETVKDYGKYSYMLCYKCAWREIISVRENRVAIAPPVIFTKDLFQTGLTILINAINIFLSNGTDAYSPSFSKLKQKNIIFELILDVNELWVKATFENQEIEQFYVQKFYESSDPEGSPLFKFVKSLLKSPEPGKKKAKFLYKWETASRHINRLHLPNILKEAFFGKSHGSIFNFKGIAVELPDDSIDVLRQLREGHLKMPNKLENRK